MKIKNFFKPEDFDGNPIPEPEENLYNNAYADNKPESSVQGMGENVKCYEKMKNNEKKREKH